MSILAHCFSCNSNRNCEVSSTYEYEGGVYPIYVCRRCRASDAREDYKYIRRQLVKSEESYHNRSLYFHDILRVTHKAMLLYERYPKSKTAKDIYNACLKRNNQILIEIISSLLLNGERN